MSEQMGDTLVAGEMMKEREPCSQGGGQKAQLFPWRWCLLLPKTPGRALHPLNNDFVMLFTLIKSAWCADS